MSGFDTSGKVQDRRTQWVRFWKWSDLSPFVQGYVEALLGSFCEELDDYSDQGGCSRRFFGFSDLAPETLARIIEDCAEACFRFTKQDGQAGKWFWLKRQRGDFEPPMCGGFPSLTVHLDDNGKVRFQ